VTTLAKIGYSRRLGHFGVTALMLGWLIGGAAITANAAELRVERGNTGPSKGLVQIVTGSSSGASVRIVEDLARLVDDGATRRLLPIVGQNALQNVADLTSLRGVDLAILQADVLDGLRRQRGQAGADTNLTYIAKLYNEEFHILARPEIKTVADLANRKVSVDVRGSETSVSAARVFDLLQVQVSVVNDNPDVALAKLRRGEIAAMVFVAAKPASVFQAIKREDALHFVPVPLNAAVAGAYVPTTLTQSDYPGVIGSDQPVDTIAVGTVLAVANLLPDSERYRNVVNFVDVFFTGFRTLLEPGHHPKWREINLAADVPGWRRFQPAQQWLDRNRPVASQSPRDLQGVFAKFLEGRQQVIGGTGMSDQQKQDLFNQFQRWQAGQGR